MSDNKSMYFHQETWILFFSILSHFHNPPVLREGVCSLCHGRQPLGGAGSRLPDDLPGPFLDGGYHCRQTQQGHWTEHWVSGAAQEAGAESSPAAGTGHGGGVHSHFVKIKMQTFSVFSKNSSSDVSSMSHVWLHFSPETQSQTVCLPTIIKMCEVTRSSFTGPKNNCWQWLAGWFFQWQWYDNIIIAAIILLCIGFEDLMKVWSLSLQDMCLKEAE